jgi:endo-1,4-beta-xylanase
MRNRLPSENRLGLADSATRHGLLFGTAVHVDALRADSQYRRALALECGVLTPENAIKIRDVRPERDRYDFSGSDEIVEFAVANDIRVRGHTLLWHLGLPNWISEGNLGSKELRQTLHEFIVTMVGRYRGRIQYWDVVNEILTEHGSLRESVWLRGIGSECIELAFRWAREADPDARLFYNEWGAEELGTKSDAVFEFVTSLRRKGVPIDGIGLQCHFDLDLPPDTESLAASMARFTAEGFEVQVTELDVMLRTPVDDTKLAAQASLFGAVVGACLDNPGCTACVVWGLTDKYSWIPSFFPGRGGCLCP